MIYAYGEEKLLKYTIIEDKFWLTHGEIISRHILRKENKLTICDFENSRYVMGEADFAIGLLNMYYWTNNKPSVEGIINNILKYGGTQTTLDLTCFWIITEVIYRSIFLLVFKGERVCKIICVNGIFH